MPNAFVLSSYACVTMSVHTKYDTWRQVQRPGCAKEGSFLRRNTTQQETAPINPNDCHRAPLTDQTLDTAAKLTHESSCITPTFTSTLHACQVPLAHITHPAGSLSTQPSAHRRRPMPHYYTLTTAKTRGTPRPAACLRNCLPT